MKEIIIEDLIYEIKGVQVMLDSDLAKLYNCKNGAKEINQAVKNNPNKFPDRYLLRITEKEFDSLKSIHLTSKGGARKGHTAFTEQGVYMLATILKSDIAIEVSIRIMDTFVKMRRYFSSNNEILLNHENRLLVLESAFDKFKEKGINKIFFENELYDAFSLLIDVFNKSNKEIIIIDNYAGKELLDILKNIDRKIIIVSKNIDDVLKSKYESQYSNVSFINNDSFHDRFIIIDKKILFSSGASFKDLGKKCFGIHKIDDMDYLNRILKVINIDYE